MERTLCVTFGKPADSVVADLYFVISHGLEDIDNTTYRLDEHRACYRR